MSILDSIYEKAKKAPQKVAFPEGANEKIMQAAYETAEEGYIIPVFIGHTDELKSLARARGYKEDKFVFVDLDDEEKKSETVNKYLALPDMLMKEKALRRRMQDPLYYAMAMLAAGEAGVAFAGIDYPTGDVLLAGQMIVGLKEGISTISSVGICDIPGFEGSEGSVLVIGDSAVCTNPTAEQLADIAISACETVQALFDWEPRCAMLSYSTLGSGQGELVDKVTEAVKLANQKRGDLNIEGEYQLDTALRPHVAQKKVAKANKVAGRANILIWPDLNAGNIGVKLIQLLGHADAYGPMLQGFNKIVCDCSRSAPVSEIKGNIVISAVRAARGQEERYGI
ncbi:phosphate acyltransferase [Hungatella hathewayi]